MEELKNEEMVTTEPRIETEVDMDYDDQTSSIEDLLRGIVLAYQDAFNKNNEDNEIEYHLTITTHKVPRPEGNRDVGYLRLERGIRKKDSDEEWDMMVVHQGMHVFKNIQEQANPKSEWRKQLYLDCLVRICGGGLEYAEFLKSAKSVKMDQPKNDLIITDTMPKPMSEDELKYKEWVKNNHITKQ